MTTRGRLRWAQYLFAAIGVVALAYCAWVWIGAKLYQARETRRLARELHRPAIHAIVPNVPPPVPPAPAPPPIVLRDGSPLGKLQIPRIGLSVIVVEGDNTADLKHGVGHIPGTALPWQRGNVALAGHRDTFFRPLRSIRPHDSIVLTTVEGTYRYRVLSTQVVTPHDVQVLNPDGHDDLTLVTCFPFYYVGSAPRRFIVRAERAPNA